VYTAFTTLNNDPYSIDYNAANIKPTHTAACATSNTDHAGTPLNTTIRAALTKGARGDGGTNYTGSFTTATKICPACGGVALLLDPTPASLTTPADPASDLDGPSFAPFPNPFDATTHLRYVISSVGDQAVDIGVYDVSGRRVKSLVDLRQAPGRYETSWNGTDETGARMANGMYFFHVVIGDSQITRRVLFLHR
jgi:hypothetical protein